MSHPVFTFTVQQLKQKMQPLPKGKISNHLPTETFYTEPNVMNSCLLAAIETKLSYAIAKL